MGVVAAAAVPVGVPWHIRERGEDVPKGIQTMRRVAPFGQSRGLPLNRCNPPEGPCCITKEGVPFAGYLDSERNTETPRVMEGQRDRER